MADIRVVDNPAAGRYEIYVNDVPAGVAAYDVTDDSLVFTHTKIDDAHEGHGLGAQLISYALEDVRQRGLRVVPKCPFVRQFIEEHPEYADLLT